MRATDDESPTVLCACGAAMRRGSENCGGCPQRRASPQEAYDASERGESLPCCTLCGEPVMPAVGRTKPQHLYGLRCLECARERKASCEYPRHPGRRVCAAISVDSYAVPNTRRTGVYDRVNACFRCAQRYKLESWQSYSLRKGAVDKTTGEVTPLQGTSGVLKLKSSDLSLYGGAENCWRPRRHYRVVNGVAVPVDCVVLPVRWAHVDRERILVVDAWVSGSLGETRRGTVWCSSVNAELDRILDPDGLSRASQRRPSPSELGWIYVRLTSTEPTGRLTAAVRLHRDSSLTLVDWIRECRALVNL